MPNIQQIVVPINGTAESFKALSLASDLAKIYQAQICLHTFPQKLMINQHILLG